jgi:hypothetical protein
LKLKRGSAILPRQAPQRGKVGHTRHAVWRGKGGHRVGFGVTSPCKLCRAMRDGAAV